MKRKKTKEKSVNKTGKLVNQNKLLKDTEKVDYDRSVQDSDNIEERKIKRKARNTV